MSECRPSPVSEGHHPGGPRRLCRFIVPGVLLLLFERESHGYDLGARLAALGLIESETDTAQVYRALGRLRRMGCVTAREMPGEGGPRRKVYSLTDEGVSMLHEWHSAIGERMEVLSRFLDRCADLKIGKEGSAR